MTGRVDEAARVGRPVRDLPLRQPATGLVGVKGHGTENDFLLLPDPDDVMQLTPALVRALCDRRSGIGADGVLRVVPTVDVPQLLPSTGLTPAEVAARAPWFMDYRNADGSVAEMCGNGMRVFVRYLHAVGLVGQDAAVATRGGVMRTRYAGDNVTVDMGLPQILADRPVVTAAVTTGRPALSGPGTAVLIPNPHVVLPVGAAELGTLDLSHPPSVHPALPHGQNVEFVTRLGERHLSMRVHERGSGETRSCGTGICAAVVATAGTPDGHAWTVDVPGGRTEVVWRSDGTVLLTGPAVLLATVTLDADGLAALTAAPTP